MRVLDVELRDAIKDMPSEAIEKLEEEIESTKYGLYAKKTLDTDSLKKIVDYVREQYGLEKASQIDDDKAIQDIKDPVEHQFEEYRRESPATGKKFPIRSIPQYAVESICRKEILMKKGSKYAEKISSMSLEQIESEMRNWIENYGLNGKYSDLVNEVDPKFGIDYYDKMDILRYVKVEKILGEQVSKFSKTEFQQKKKDFEYMRSNLLYRDGLDEMQALNENIGIGTDCLYMTMADVADAFEAREKELEKSTSKTQSKFSIGTLLKNALKGKSTRESVANSQRSASREKNIDGVKR